MMKKDALLHSMLTHLAQDAIHPEAIDLWPSIQVRLLAGETLALVEEPEMKHKSNLQVHPRALLTGALTFLLAFGLLFALPQGRAWAQMVIRFFTPAQSDAFLLPDRGSTQVETGVPTLLAALIPGCEESGTAVTYQCAVSSVETDLGFDIRELPSTPEGFSFASVTANLNQNQVFITYARKGGELVIIQTHGEKEITAWETTWGAVPTESVENVDINGFVGEYVRGMFVVKSQTGTKAEWEPEAPVQRLRWREGEMLFELQMHGLPGDDDLIGKDWLISLAESLK